MADKFCYNKEYITNNSMFYLSFVGYADKNIQDKINKLIDKFVQNSNLEDTFTNVKKIRTILKSFNVEEEKLRLSFKTNDLFEFVDYRDTKMVTFEKRCGDKAFKMEVDHEKHINKFDEVEVKEIEDKIASLIDYNIIDLVDENEYSDAKTLIKIYELFYGIKPNFNNARSLSKMKSMLPILKFFDIPLPHDGKDLKEFMNSGIENIYNELFPLRDNYDTSFTLDEKYNDKIIEKIKYVGEVVLESITDTNELERISEIFYKAYSQICLGYHSTSRYSCNEEEKKLGFEIIQKVNQRANKKDRH